MEHHPTRRRAPLAVLMARLTLAAFAANLVPSAAWSQSFVRVAPITAPAVGSVGAAGSASLSPSFLAPAPLGSAPALSMAPLTAPIAGPSAAAPLAPAAAAAAPALMPAVAIPAASADAARPAQAAPVSAHDSLTYAAADMKNDGGGSSGARNFDGGAGKGTPGGDGSGGSRTPPAAPSPASAPVMALTKHYFPGVNSRRLGADTAGGIAILNAAVKAGYLIGAVQGHDTPKGHAEMGTLMRISQPEMKGDKMTVIMEPVRSVKITGYAKSGDVTVANVEYIATETSDPQKLKELASAAGQILHQYSHTDPEISQDMVAEIMEEKSIQRFVNLLSQELPFHDHVKQELLAAPSLEARLNMVVMELMGHFKDISDEEKYGQGDGDMGGALESPEGLQAKMDAIGMPHEIQEIAKKEFDKMENMEPTSSEAGKIRTYLEWLTEMPWGQRTTDNFDIAEARRMLDQDHGGLEKVKERVLEFLALRKKTGSKKGAILAFTGPPGVGKTSIAGDIAKALGRKFVRLSLGGVHDESVLRGHGRTYVGAMPGEIMRQMKTAGVINPVMLLDEADKIGRNGNAGDPTAALLEILDPEQNNTFRDRYLDVPYDLSEVLFVVTSNELSNIPEPLRDRMEIIEFDGYTTLEKMAIAEQHVIPQKMESVGLKPGETKLTPAAIRKIIEGYTMEAGVRSLREKLEAVLRKVSAWTETKGEKVPSVVDEKDVEKYLGVPHFSPRQVAQNGVGVATGLAVNAYGGSTLNVEVAWEPGSGQLKLRKQFGDDIEDSAKNAYKYVKLNAAKYGLEHLDFTKIDLDIDITPAGKVDGPSAGGLMVTAILSSLTGRAVTPGLAMTGEITARGDILPIGGLKQKVMAAHRMGYTEVIFPYANLKDVQDIPQEVRDGITLTAVRTYDEIYPKAVVKQATAKAASTPAPTAPAASAAPAARSWNWWNPATWPIFNR